MSDVEAGVPRGESGVGVTEAERAYGYLSRLFKSVAPQCEPLPTLMGVCTQIDNYIAGLRDLRRSVG